MGECLILPFLFITFVITINQSSMSDFLQLEDEKQDFLEEVTTLLGKCQCRTPKCTAIVFETVGQSGFCYNIEYDPKPKGSSNVLIYLRKGDNVVFNGECKTQHDIAQVLRMVII